mgnify:FL=1
MFSKGVIRPSLVLSCLTFSLAAAPAMATLNFGPETVIQDGLVDLDVGTYSVPCLSDWNNDGKQDLIVGQSDGRVRLYLNHSATDEPSFSGFSYVQNGAADLSVGASGCLGSFPRMVDWNADGMKDLLVGKSSPGNVVFFQNQNTDADPRFSGSANVAAGGGTIDVGFRCTVCPVDWDDDGDTDLITGDYYGNLTYFENAADAGNAPVLNAGAAWMDIGSRSSPCVADFDRDGDLDLLVGQTDGKLKFYARNGGTDRAPTFDPATFATYLGGDDLQHDIDLAGDARSRPCVCDWTGDGLADILVGGSDGKVYLYQGVPEPATVTLLALGAAAMLRRRRRA